MIAPIVCRAKTILTTETIIWKPGFGSMARAPLVAGPILTYKLGWQSPPISQVCPLLNEALPQKLFHFTTSLTLEPKKSLLAKATVFQIVMVSGKNEICECLLSHLEVCLLSKKDAVEFSKVFLANGKHDIGRYILSQNKKH